MVGENGLSNTSSRAAMPPTPASTPPSKVHDPPLGGKMTDGSKISAAPAKGTPTSFANVQETLRSVVACVMGILQPYVAEHARFVEYQRTLPVRTVVPEPPNTLRDYVNRQIWRMCRLCCLVLFFFYTWPLWLVLHLMLKMLDLHQRRAWLKHQRAWPFKSVPHLRENVHPPPRNFPLENWHLRCEDGRQRWYYGAPLRDGEAHNELGRAQLCGQHTVTDYHQLLHRRAAVDGAEAPSRPPTREAPEGGERQNGSAARNGGVAGSGDAAPWLPDVLEEKCAKRAFLEKYQLGLAPPSAPRLRASAETAMDDGVRFLLKLQDPFSGHWPNDYGGCMFLLAGLVYTNYIVSDGNVHRMFAAYPEHHHVRVPSNKRGGSTNGGGHGNDYAARVLGVPAAERAGEEACRCGEATRQELIRYLRNYQNQDGGWGQHTEGHSTMLGTVLNYVSMRLLGVPANDPQAKSARDWIHAHGGATTTPMWGRVWLCILGVYNWEGVDPIPPEMMLLPDWVPFSLGRAWCHSRVIAIPFAHFYGLRWSAPAFPTVLALRAELYTQSYSSIAWRSFRGAVCECDLYTPTSPLFRVVMGLFDFYERHSLPFLRRYALELSWRHIAYDDENTHFICLGPVNKSLNMLATWIREGEHSVRFQGHCDHVADYLYMGPAGMLMSGYNGSQLWDTSFAVQAICACRQEMVYPTEMALAHHYVDTAQVQEDPMTPEVFYRHRTKGAWNFSTAAQGWQVSDCTAEGLRALLLLPQYDFPVRRIYDGVDEILSLRNGGFGGDGGWATYEPTRGPRYCELLGCSELFKDVMIDYSYAECSSSCIHTLSLFREQYPHYRRSEVDHAISEGIACVLGKQQPDGGYYGSWAVCYTYAAWIVADALRVSKELPGMATHPHCVKLIDFLLCHQNDDGGWGEDISACVRQMWVDNPDGSQVVQTAWAVMAIICASGAASDTVLERQRRIRRAVDRGIQLIMSRQLESGDWAQERISGVFNGNNPIHYPGYKNSMTVWALGKYNAWKVQYVIASA